MKKVYIAHPLRGDVEGNLKRIEAICRDIQKEQRGVIPFSPLHAFGFVDPMGKQDQVLNWCGEMVKQCDEVWVYGSAQSVKESKGVQMEIAIAEAFGILVVDKTVQKLEEQTIGGARIVIHTARGCGRSEWIQRYMERVKECGGAEIPCPSKMIVKEKDPRVPYFVQVEKDPMSGAPRHE